MIGTSVKKELSENPYSMHIVPLLIKIIENLSQKEVLSSEKTTSPSQRYFPQCHKVP